MTFKYSCIDSDHWRKEEEFSGIEKIFCKYTNNFNESNIHTEKDKLSIISIFKCTRIGMNEDSSNLMTSTIDIFNYTKLPEKYEKQYMYTYILENYKVIYIMNKTESNFSKKYLKIDEILKANKSLTEDKEGNAYSKALRKRLKMKME